MRYGWALDIDAWNGLREILHESKWKKTFLEKDYQSNIPKNSGIYIICAQTKYFGGLGEAIDSLYTAIYVGQSKDLNKRFSDHVKGYGNVSAAKLTFKRLDFWWMVVDIDNLNKFEQSLIHALGPNANKVNVIRATLGNPIKI